MERFLVEFVRIKDDRFFGPLSLAQVISVGLVVVGVVGMRRLRQPAGSKPSGSESEGEEEGVGAAGVDGRDSSRNAFEGRE